MFLWSDFVDRLDDFYEFVSSEFDDHGGFIKVMRGDSLFGDDIQSLEKRGLYNEKEWYVLENFKEIVPFRDYKDQDRLKAVIEGDYSESHNDMAYFSDYADHSKSEFEPKFFEELKRYYTDEELAMYEGDISWLLDGYAIKEIMPRLLEKFSKADVGLSR